MNVLTNGSPLQERKPLVFIIQAGFSGCAYWRYATPIRKLRKLGSPLDYVLYTDYNIDLSNQIMQNADLIVMQAPGSHEHTRVMQEMQKRGIPVYVDYDDISFELSPCNPKYRDLGLKETEEWKTGRDLFYPEWNKMKYDGFLGSIQNCDGFTTTTPFIAQVYKDMGVKNIHILPNSVDFDYYKFLPRPELGNEVSIGWFGGDSHRDDLDFVKDVLKEICLKYPQVRLVIKMPANWVDLFKDVPIHQKEFHLWSELENHPLALSCKFWDIGIAPLTDTKFNRCKSNIKWQEYSAVKVPSVCSNLEPYQNIKDGVTGFLATSEKEWFEKLCILVENKDLRKTMAQEAWLDCYKLWNLDTNCRIWEKTYLEAINNAINTRTSLHGNRGPVTSRSG